MTASQQESPLSEAEYLTQERQAQERHEYIQGDLFALAGASRKHNVLSGQMFAALLAHLEGTPCYPYMADMRLHINAHSHYTYPDIMVVCGEEAYAEEDMADDATVVIEVLSESTESYDRGRKFLHYQSLPSIKEYVLISQDAVLVEVYHRQDGTSWTYQAMHTSDDILRLESIGFSWTLGELYQGVALPG